MEMKNDGLLAKMVIQIPGQGFSIFGAAGTVIEEYMTRDKIYMPYPGTAQWVYLDVSPGLDLAPVDQGLSPQSMLKILESAKSVEVVADDSSRAKYYLTLDPDKVLDNADINKYFENLNQRGMALSPDQFLEVMSDFMSEMKIYLTVDKKTGCPERFDMDFGRNILKAVSRLQDTEIPSDAEMTMKMGFKFGDYGKKSFDLSLPKEALDAKPLKDPKKPSI